MKNLQSFQKVLSDKVTVKTVTIIPDDNFHRFEGEGDKLVQKSGRYILNDIGGLLVGVYGKWRTGLSEVWHSKSLQSLSDAERKSYAQSTAKAKEQHTEAQVILLEEVKIRAQKLIRSTRDAPMDNVYAKRKGIHPYGCKVLGNTNTLAVPMFDGEDEQGNSNIVNLQFIYSDGTKKSMTNSKKKGCYLRIGNNVSKVIVICTGASIAQATAYNVIIAFNAGNLLLVAQRIAKSKKPNQAITIAADNDAWGDVNIGVQKATEAAKAIQACLAIPEFANGDVSQKPNDFNDLHQLAELEEVARQINATFNKPLPPRSTNIKVVDIVSLDQIKMEPINWLIQNWLPLGKLTLLAGQAGTGKTQLAISIAAMLSAGRHLPDLKTKDAQIGDIGLIIIDPIVSVVAGDSNKSSDVRAGLQPIVDMAQELNCAVIGITHYRKSSNVQNISDDVLGSQAYIAVPRVAWGTKRRYSDNTCVVAIIENNLAPLLGGYEYTIESQTVFNDLSQAIEKSRIVWGEYRVETVSQLLKDFASESADDANNLSESFKLLIDLLKDGSSIKVSDIKCMVDKHPSISWLSVDRAGTALKVVRQRTNAFPSETYWCLPLHLVKPNQACA